MFQRILSAILPVALFGACAEIPSDGTFGGGNVGDPIDPVQLTVETDPGAEVIVFTLPRTGVPEAAELARATAGPDGTVVLDVPARGYVAFEATPPGAPASYRGVGCAMENDDRKWQANALSAFFFPLFARQGANGNSLDAGVDNAELIIRGLFGLGADVRTLKPDLNGADEAAIHAGAIQAAVDDEAAARGLHPTEYAALLAKDLEDANVEGDVWSDLSDAIGVFRPGAPPIPLGDLDEGPVIHGFATNRISTDIAIAQRTFGAGFLDVNFVIGDFDVPNPVIVDDGEAQFTVEPDFARLLFGDRAGIAAVDPNGLRFEIENAFAVEANEPPRDVRIYGTGLFYPSGGGAAELSGEFKPGATVRVDGQVVDTRAVDYGRLQFEVPASDPGDFAVEIEDEDERIVVTGSLRIRDREPPTDPASDFYGFDLFLPEDGSVGVAFSDRTYTDDRNGTARIREFWSDGTMRERDVALRRTVVGAHRYVRETDAGFERNALVQAERNLSVGTVDDGIRILLRKATGAQVQANFDPAAALRGDHNVAVMQWDLDRGAVMRAAGIGSVTATGATAALRCTWWALDGSGPVGEDLIVLAGDVDVTPDGCLTMKLFGDDENALQGAVTQASGVVAGLVDGKLTIALFGKELEIESTGGRRDSFMGVGVEWKPGGEVQYGEDDLLLDGQAREACLLRYLVGTELAPGVEPRPRQRIETGGARVAPTGRLRDRDGRDYGFLTGEGAVTALASEMKVHLAVRAKVPMVQTTKTLAGESQGVAQAFQLSDDFRAVLSTRERCVYDELLHLEEDGRTYTMTGGARFVSNDVAQSFRGPGFEFDDVGSDVQRPFVERYAAFRGRRFVRFVRDELFEAVLAEGRVGPGGVAAWSGRSEDVRLAVQAPVDDDVGLSGPYKVFSFGSIVDADLFEFSLFEGTVDFDLETGAVAFEGLEYTLREDFTTNLLGIDVGGTLTVDGSLHDVAVQDRKLRFMPILGGNAFLGMETTGNGSHSFWVGIACDAPPQVRESLIALFGLEAEFGAAGPRIAAALKTFEVDGAVGSGIAIRQALGERAETSAQDFTIEDVDPLYVEIDEFDLKAAVDTEVGNGGGDTATSIMIDFILQF